MTQNIQPCIEIAVCNIGERTVEDESTDDGKKWHYIFSQITHIEGFRRVGWGRRVDEPDTNLFIVGKIENKLAFYLGEHCPIDLPSLDWASLRNHYKFMDKYGDLSKEIMDLLTRDFDMYHFYPNTSSRSFLYAPLTSVHFFWHFDEDTFDAASKAFFNAIEKADGCRGLAHGEAVRPPRHERSKWLENGRAYIALVGWETLEAWEAAIQSKEVTSKFQAVKDSTKARVSYGLKLTVVEQNGYEVSNRRL